MGTELVAVSVDPVADNKRVTDQLGLEFPILADESRSVVTDYGVLHVGGGIGGRDIARPAILLIGPDGTVMWRYLTENWRVRIRPEKLIAVVRGMG
jgi:peroxiredoxin